MSMMHTRRESRLEPHHCNAAFTAKAAAKFAAAQLEVAPALARGDAQAQLAWATLVFRVLQAAQGDGSDALAALSLEASRRALTQLRGAAADRATALALSYMVRGAVALLHRGVRVCRAGPLGPRIMLAARDAAPNTTLCSEAPFADWAGGGVQAGLDAIALGVAADAEQRLPASGAYVPPAATGASAAKSDALWCHDVHLADAVATLLARGSRLSRVECRRVAALRANCHHYTGRANEDRIAVFDVLSKISHSCAPNCYYDGDGNLYAGRAVARGAALGFPYFDHKCLIRGTRVRRAALEESHAFVCGCPRCACADPAQHGRAFVCPACGSSSVCAVVLVAPHGGVGAASPASSSSPAPAVAAATADAVGASGVAASTAAAAAAATSSSSSSLAPMFAPVAFVGARRWRLTHGSHSPASDGDRGSAAAGGGAAAAEAGEQRWVCVKCRDVPSAAELAKCLATEERLEASTDALLSEMKSAAAPLPKNVFERVKADAQDCLSLLGRRHWLYLECVRALMRFYVRVGAQSSATGPTRVVALEAALRWALKFVAAAAQQGVMLHAPGAAAAFVFEAARALLVMCPNSRWRVHAALVVQCALDVDASFGERNGVTAEVRDLAGRSLAAYLASDASTTMLAASAQQRPATPLDALCRAAEMDSDDAGLIVGWENHLTDRVAALMQTRGAGAAQLRTQFNLPALPAV